ncbi:MAG: DUF6515 family protein [Smithella sp.]|jgi:hypothetical protein
MLCNLKKYSAITLSIIFLAAISFSGFALQAQAEGPRKQEGPGHASAKSGGNKAAVQSGTRAPDKSVNQAPASKQGSTYAARKGSSSKQKQFVDSRYKHNRSYPLRGRSFRSLPRDHRMIMHGNARYYSHNGAWYRHHHGRYLVVAPPIGLFVPFLPFYYSTVYWHGIPYYYANDTYYTGTAGGYAVVEPPEGEVSDTPSDEDNDSANIDENKMFIYPRNGQNEKQQANDRYECHKWAVEQTNYDPTGIPPEIPVQQIMQKRSDYQQAMAACLDGRGYTTK